MRIPHNVISEASDLFYELVFGTEGGWIGFLFISCVMFLLTAKVRIAGIPCIIVSLLLGIRMIQSGLLSTDNDLWWIVILYFVNAGLLGVLAVRD